jgi:putative flippase GtrA
MKRKLTNLLGKYPTYFIVGGFVTSVVIILRHIIGGFLQRSPEGFVISIVAVYAVGIILSYILQSRFTFQTQKTQTRSFKYKFLAYVTVQLLLPWPISIKFQDTIAFIIASFITSVATYTVSKMHIFKQVRDPTAVFDRVHHKK